MIPPAGIDDDAVMGAFARFLSMHKQQPLQLQQQELYSMYDPVQMLTKTVAHLERRIDMVERMFALQQQTNDALLRATASPASTVSTASPTSTNMPRAAKKTAVRPNDELHNHHDYDANDHEQADDNEYEDDNDVIIRRITVNPPPPPHAMLMVNERCRRAAA
jgi:hypothetical protein